jgi:hypothetical protein
LSSNEARNAHVRNVSPQVRGVKLATAVGKIECNPNGQWGWLPDADDITAAFADILSTRTEGGGAR